MNKQTLTREMKEFVGGGVLINKSEIARCFRRDRKGIPRLVAGLEPVPDRKRVHMYYIADVAECILKEGEKEK